MTGDSNMIEAFCVWKQFLEMPEAQQNVQICQYHKQIGKMPLISNRPQWENIMGNHHCLIQRDIDTLIFHDYGDHEMVVVTNQILRKTTPLFLLL